MPGLMGTTGASSETSLPVAVRVLQPQPGRIHGWCLGASLPGSRGLDKVTFKFYPGSGAFLSTAGASWSPSLGLPTSSCPTATLGPPGR